MRIGLVKRSFRLQGGGERQIGYLIAGLLTQGHAVHLFSEQPPPSEKAVGVTYHTLSAIFPSAELCLTRAVRTPTRRPGGRTKL